MNLTGYVMDLNSWINKILKKYPESFPIQKRMRILIIICVLSSIFTFLLLLLNLIFDWTQIWLIIADGSLLFFFGILLLLIIKGKGDVAIQSFIFIYYLFILLFISDITSPGPNNIVDIFIYVIFVIAIALIDELFSMDIKRTKIHFIFGSIIIFTSFITIIVKNKLDFIDSFSYLVIAFVSFGLTLTAVYESHQLRIIHFTQIIEQEKTRLDAFTKALEQYIPICAHCKKIRKDNGEWLRVEDFIRQKTSSTVQFTHGLCDECMDKYYPDEI